MLVDRLLIVGYGSIGQRHLRIARNLLPKADIRVLRHQRCDFLPEYANGCMCTIEEALAFAPQAAVIANPSTFHLSSAMPLAGAGVHLLVEKPLAASVHGVPQLLDIAASQGTVLMTAYNLRFLSSLQQFRKHLQAGCIGRLDSVRCEIGQYLPSWRPGTDYRLGVSGSKALGGGALLELSHEIDYLRWIFGEVAWVRATLSQQSNLDIDVEDTAHIILGFVENTDRHQLIASLNMDLVRHDTTRQCTAIGDRGSLRWNGITGSVEIFPAGSQKWEQLFLNQPLRDESYVAEWEHFLSCIDLGAIPLVSGQDGLEVLRIIDAARRSASEYKPMMLAMLGESEWTQ